MAALSGFGVLALQVLYLRLFSLVLHNSVYSFGAVVALFLVALSLGAAIASRLGSHLELESLLINACQATGIAVAASVLAFLLWTELDYFEAGEGFYDYLAGVAAFSGVVIVVPVTIAGIILPLVWQGARNKFKADDVAIGHLTGINTVAAAVGSLAASFVLLPTVGLLSGFAVVAALYIAAGFVFLPAARSRGHAGTTIACLVFCGAYAVVSKRYDGTTSEERLVQRWESAYGWIDVIEFTDTKHLQLRQNIHYGLGSTGSITMERRQAHLPLLLHPDPKNALFIGLATGITAGGALDHAGVEVDVVELIPDVVRGAAAFSAFNRDVVTRADVKVNDGRHYLQATDKLYDVVVADLFVPWESHTGYLYTRENYEATLARLSPDGIFTQWLPMWQLGTDEFKLIADTFASVFPNATVWFGKLHEHWTIVGLVGTREKLALESLALAKRLENAPPPIPGDRSWFKKPQHLFRMYAGDWPAPVDADLNTDETPRLEFNAPISAWTPGARLRFDTLRDLQRDVLGKLPRRAVSFDGVKEQSLLTDKAVRRYHAQMLSE